MNLLPEEHPSADQFRTNAEALFIAKRFLAGQIGVIAASRQLSPLRHDAAADLAEILDVFLGIDAQTDTLPLGEVRNQWNPEALASKDLEIAECESIHFEDATEAATRIIQLLEIPS